ncbi:MAG: hypothetical protein ACO1PM_10955 [Acidovorax sp.]|jgi:hypothetical protein
MQTPWPPNIELHGSVYMVRPVTLQKKPAVPDRIFIFDEDGAPVITVRGPWASYPEALDFADSQLRRHVSPPPVDVFGGH